MLLELTMAATLTASSGGPSDADLAAMAWRFTPHTFAGVMSGGRWLPYRAQRFAGNVVAEALARGGARLIFCWPPRHGKSDLFSLWTPAWFIDNWPYKRVILTSYNDRLARWWGRRVRQSLQQSRYSRTRFLSDSNRADQWNTPEDGGMLTAGTRGTVTGFGGDLIGIDDPFKNWAEATNPLYQQLVYEWFHNTLYDRLEPNGSIIIAMQRWDEGDLVGRLLVEEPDEWTVIRLPALAEEDDPLGRALGEPLCPERYDRKALLRMRRGVRSEVVWDAKFQQRPHPTGIGCAYSSWSDLNVDDTIGPRKELPLQLDFDFNIDPGMHVEIGQHDEREDRLTCFAEVHGPRMPIPAAMAEVERWIAEQGGWQWPELHVFGDAAGHSEDKQTAATDYDLVAAHIRRMGITNYRIRVPKSAPSQADSINAVNSALRDIDGRPHYFVHPRCTRLIHDFKHVRLGPDRKIVKRNASLTHASDAERYRINYLRPVGMVNVPTTGGRFSV